MPGSRGKQKHLLRSPAGLLLNPRGGRVPLQVALSRSRRWGHTPNRGISVCGWKLFAFFKGLILNVRTGWGERDYKCFIRHSTDSEKRAAKMIMVVIMILTMAIKVILLYHQPSGLISFSSQTTLQGRHYHNLLYTDGRMKYMGDK